MTPPEMLLASLGSCAGFYAAQYLRNHKLATEGTVVRVAADKAKGPARLDNFRIALEIPRDLRSEEHTSELQSRLHLVCRLLLEKKKNKNAIQLLRQDEKITTPIS